MPRFSDSERIVVTGMGVASPVGNTVDEAWDNVLNGRHGFTNIRESILSGYESIPVHVAGLVKDFDLNSDSAFAGRKELRRNEWGLAQQFILWAGAQALRQAGLISGNNLRVGDEGVIDPERFGVIVGTGIGDTDTLTDGRMIIEKEKIDYARAVKENDQDTIDRILTRSRLRPTQLLNALPGRVAGAPSIVFEAKAFWKGLLQECASGNAAIIEGIEKIRAGRADVVLVGGTEGVVSPTTTAHFGAAGAVTSEKNPDIACRPADVNRSGLVMAQGAGTMIIEPLDHALNRGADIKAELVGWAENSDARFPTVPDPPNVVKCLHNALAKTGRAIKNISFNGHLTSTDQGDLPEIQALIAALEAKQLVGGTSNKGVTGHMFGGGGAFEANMSVMMLHDQLTPPTHGLVTAMPELRGYEHLFSGAESIPGDIEMVLNSSFGFGGNNAVTIFGKPR